MLPLDLDTTVFPTHRCFDDAAEYLNAVATRALSPPHALERLRVCHGIIRFPEGQPDAGTRAAHAWVEDGTDVIDAGILKGERIYLVRPKADFYAALRVEAVTRYTARELLAHYDRTASTGPWRSDLKLLLRGQTPSHHDGKMA